jgi:hypothetical protein
MLDRYDTALKNLSPAEHHVCCIGGARECGCSRPCVWLHDALTSAEFVFCVTLHCGVRCVIRRLYPCYGQFDPRRSEGLFASSLFSCRRAGPSGICHLDMGWVGFGRLALEMRTRPPEKLDAQATANMPLHFSQFLRSLLRFRSGWSANHALQRLTRPSRPGCNRTPSWAGSLGLGRWSISHAAQINTDKH